MVKFELEEILKKYKLFDDNDFLGFRNKIKDYVINLNEKDLQHEYLKQEFLYEIVELQKDNDFSKDIFNEYVMRKNNANKNIGQDYTPKCLVDVMTRLIYNKKELDFEGMKIFYEPSGGTGSNMLGIIEQYQKTNSITKWNDCLVVHQELDVINCCFATLNYATRGINSIIICGDTLKNEIKYAFQTINKNPIAINFADISYFGKDEELQRIKKIFMNLELHDK